MVIKHMSKLLENSQAADLADVTLQGLQYLRKGEDPPIRETDGYPCKAYGEWLRRRAVKGLGVNADGQVFDLKSEQARFNHHAANLKQLEEAQLRGDLLPADLVLEQWQTILANVRGRLLAMPSRLAAQAYAAQSRQEIERLLQQGIHETLQELSDDGKPKTHQRPGE